MNRIFNRLAALAVLAGSQLCAQGLGQETGKVSLPAAPASGSAAQPDPLPGLPRPLDTPRSLLQPAPAQSPYSCAVLERPCFQEDPRLDPPGLPAPGWFAGVEVGILDPHVQNKLIETVQVGARPPDIVKLPSAPLDWAGSPRFELGYRFPSGFGEFYLAYRFLASEGTGTIGGPDGPATLASRLDMNIADVDYASREFSLWPSCEMKWFFGIRTASIFFDSRSDEPFDLAAAGSGILETRLTNSYWGIGPHFGVELAHRLNDFGLSAFARTDGGILLGQLRQGFFETITAGSGGGPTTGETRDSHPQAVPMLKMELGLSWQPPAWNHACFFVGYEYEYWWNVGRMSSTSSRGTVDDQGVVLRAEYNF